jgi:hypothetical protein
LSVFGGYQNEIYLGGLEDVTPELPTDLTRLEALAQVSSSVSRPALRTEPLPADCFGEEAGSGADDLAQCGAESPAP